MVPFAGYEMPVQYAGVLEEAKATRSQIGLFDVSHMGQVSVRGKKAVEALNALVTNDLSKVALGQAQYSMLLNPEGGVIDDIIVYRRHEEEAFICVKASNRLTDVAWLKNHLSKEVSLEDQSDALSLIAVQGPLAESLLSQCSDPALAKNLNYYWAAEAKVLGISCYLSRTGYTGEDGYEIYVENSKAPAIWNGLLDAGRPHGILPVGLGARDTLRLEMGYPLHGHEISATISPLEAGLQWVVKMKKAGGFIGLEALQKMTQNGGPKRLLRGFAVEDRRMARQGARIFSPQQKLVGEITSGTFSPHLHHPIALGFVEAAVAGEKDFLLEVRDQFVPMHVHPLPFVASHTKKKA
jgi:aminomethyltransferase